MLFIAVNFNSVQDHLHSPRWTVTGIFKSWKPKFQSSASSAFKPFKETCFLWFPFWGGWGFF